MERIKHFYKEILPLYILFSYCLGYVFVTTYYSTFGVDIEYYISITDLLFLSIYLLVSLTIILVIVEILLKIIVMFIYPIDYEKLEKEDEKKLYKKRGNAEMISFLILFVLSFIISYYTGEYLYTFTILFTLLPIKMISASSKFDKSRETEINSDNAETFRKLDFDILNVMIGIILFFLFLLYGWKESSNVKNNNGLLFSKNIKFFYKNKNITSDKNNIFIGETSEYLFMYDKKINETHVYNKSDLENFSIKDPTVMSNKDKMIYEQKIKEVKEFLEPIDSLK